jgi:glucosamine--fructose-6-phosphate aminotransferase (isomerizing)
MCGIVGYCGSGNAPDYLISGLKRLEYRGYDSAGISVGKDNGTIQTFKKQGKLNNLISILPDNLKGTWGIGHTRWATHGGVNDVNAHPHLDESNKIAIIHNGIIENYQILKAKLTEEGVAFRSDTDSEVIAHLIAKFYKGSLIDALIASVEIIKGTYGIVCIHADHPNELIGVRNGSPLCLGIGDGEMILASDVPAMLAHTKQVIYLDDGEIVKITPDQYHLFNLKNQIVQKKVNKITWDLEEIEKGSYPHFMLKEIHEQVESIPRAMLGRINDDLATAHLGGLNLTNQELSNIERIKFIAAGTSFHAGLVGSYLMENLARIPCSTELASELRYRNPIIERNSLYFAITQSGETMDTLFAMRELQRKGGTVLGICNVIGSTIARESNGGVYIHSGPEIAVASTKAFTSQITAIYLYILIMARMKHMSWVDGKAFINGLKKVPEQIRQILDKSQELEKLAKKYSCYGNFLFLGRGINYPVALEAALKLKEISYIHAEGYSAAEIKHGPIALINENTPSVFLVPDDSLHDKIISNMREVKARNGKIIAVAVEGDDSVREIADDVITVPHTMEYFYPYLMTVPLQLFAYYCAIELKRDVDQPRNLAKSVTVE